MTCRSKSNGFSYLECINTNTATKSEFWMWKVLPFLPPPLSLPTGLYAPEKRRFSFRFLVLESWVRSGHVCAMLKCTEEEKMPPPPPWTACALALHAPQPWPSRVKWRWFSIHSTPGEPCRSVYVCAGDERVMPFCIKWGFLGELYEESTFLACF